MAAYRGDVLVWGHGPREFEVFLEPTCPYSGKAFGKLEQLLGEVGEDKVTVKLRLHSQPWHMFSPVLVRAILAAAASGGKDAAKQVMAAIYAHIPEFEFERHATGPNRDPWGISIARKAIATAAPIRPITKIDARPSFPSRSLSTPTTKTEIPPKRGNKALLSAASAGASARASLK